MSEWHTETLGRLADATGGVIRTGPFGSQLHRHEYVDGGEVAVVMPKDMIDGRIVSDSIARIDRDTATRLAEHLLQPADIVLARRGDVGRSAWVDASDGSVLCGTGSMRIHFPDGEIMPRYLHYYLRSASAAEWLQGQAVGATMPNLNADIVRGLPIRYPNRRTQRRVVEILDSVDALIENNRRRIALLGHMAQTIYRDWFVHFRYPGRPDDELVDSPLGRVSTEFEVRRLGDLATINQAQRKPEPEEEIVYVDISALGERTITPPSAIPGLGAPGRARRVLSDGDVLWSMVRPGRRGHGLVLRAPVNWIGSTGIAVISPHRVPPSFLFESLSTSTFSDYLVGKEQGAAYPAVRPADFEEFLIALPPEDLLRRFDAAVAPLHGLAWELAYQGRTATQVRDILLPKLVAGTIDVSELDLDALLQESAA